MGSHEFDYDKTRFLCREKHYKKRIIKEMTNIQKNNTVNKRSDLSGLSKVYHKLLGAPYHFNNNEQQSTDD